MAQRLSKGAGSLLRRAEKALAERDWDQATTYALRVLDTYEDNPRAHLVVFMAGRHIASLDDLRAVAEQIVRQTPYEDSLLRDVVTSQADALGAARAAEVAGLLGSHPELRLAFDARFSNLEVAKRAFDSVFGDPDWVSAVENSNPEDAHRLERARLDADDVFVAAAESDLEALAEACGLAEKRVPQITELLGEARGACDREMASLREKSEGELAAVEERYAHLDRDVALANAGLGAGALLVVVGTVAAVIAAMPSEGTASNALHTFPVLTIALATVAVASGIGLLVLRSRLARANAQAISDKNREVHGIEWARDRRERELEELAGAVRYRSRLLAETNLMVDDVDSACVELMRSVCAVTGEEFVEPEETAVVETPEPEAIAPAGEEVDFVEAADDANPARPRLVLVGEDPAGGAAPAGEPTGESFLDLDEPDLGGLVRLGAAARRK